MAGKQKTRHERVLQGKQLSVRFGQSLSQTRLFAVGGILVHNALGNRFINSGGGGAQLRAGGGHTLGQGDLILLDGGLNAGLHHTIPQVLCFAHLHALHGGLNIGQLPSPPRGYLLIISIDYITTEKKKTQDFF